MNPMPRRRRSFSFLIAALIAVAIATYWESREKTPAPPAAPAAESRVSRPEAPPASPATDDVAQSDEEREALATTLALIERGGPFPYPGRDGSTFQNRERRLPEQPRGYYREYTVPTHGASNRGARRVVTGREGERWYTRDHYRTFTRIDASAPVR